MTADRADGRCVLWVTHPPVGDFDANVNDCSPDVVPGDQVNVIDVHDGMADRLTVPSGGAVVGGGGGAGGGGAVTVTTGSSSSSVSTDTELSLTTS